MIQELISIFERDLQKLKQEIHAFSHEENLWRTTGDITNSAGNLVLHLTGNLNYYIGNILGNNGYERDRQAEFESGQIPAHKLLSDIDDLIDIVTETIQKLTDEDLSSAYPEDVFGREMTIFYMLVHLSSHLSYHLGQINYIRRTL